ncbi:MAG: murein biosynthesis integral membrane protein MurJ [Candidatus Brocadiia bacterium]|nr:murein biosynthesis integral membrane protein MurJ [Candidatus Brocadiia bacterium]
MASERRQLVRRTALIAALTLLSRVLGLVRDVACAAAFGAGLEWDAFSFAFRVPNLLRKLFAEGALGAAFVPTFTEYLEHRPREDAWRLAGRVATVMVALLLVAVLIGEGIVLILPQAAPLNRRWRLALGLTAVMLPYMLLICLTSLAGAILNALKHFFAPALAPVLLNLCWIAAVVGVAPLVARDTAGRVFVVAGGIVVAGALQLGLQLAALRRRGFRWRPGLDLGDPGLRRIALGMAPVLLGMAAFQVNVLLDGVIALSLSAPEGQSSFSFLGATIPYPMRIGATSVLYYGNRLMQFPLGVFGIALATAAFPALSSLAARKDWRGFSQTLTDGLALAVFVGLPAGVGLAVLGRPAVELLFERGAFTAPMTARTQAVLVAYCVGLWAYCAQQMLVRSFYSLQDMRTPMWIALGSVAVNLTLNLTLIWPLAESGLAAATAISAILQVVMLYAILVRRGRLRRQGRLLATALKSAAATGLMAAAVWAVLTLMPAHSPGDGLLGKAVRVFVPMAAGCAVYVGAAVALKAREVRQLLGALARPRRVD